MKREKPRIFGILNITEDSFSDGGLYLNEEKSIMKANQLVEEGADVIDVGPASSNPDSKQVSSTEEIRRIRPIFERFSGRIELSVDSFQPETQLWAAERKASYLNDVHAFSHPDIYDTLEKSECSLIVMHSVQKDWKAEKVETDPSTILGRVERFLAARVDELTAAGIGRKRIIVDPGMGYFLGSNPSSSIAVLHNIAELKRDLGLPVMVSVSRKSFLRSLTGRDVQNIGAATLAAEMYAALHDVDYIRTHDAGSLRDALLVLDALES